MRTSRPLLSALLLACLLAAQTPAAAAQTTLPTDAGKAPSRARVLERSGVEGDGAVNLHGWLDAPQLPAAVPDNDGAVYNVRQRPFGARGDGRTLAGCSISAGAAALTCASGFAATDASKLLVVPGAGAGGADLSTTILSFRSATQVALAASAATTVTGKTVTYATNDTAAIQSAIKAAGAAGGGVVSLPPGWYGVTNGALTVAANHVRLVGAGWATRVATFTATGDTLTFSNGLSGNALDTYLYGTGVENLRIEPAVKRTSGWEIRAAHFNVAYFNRLSIRKAYGAMMLGRPTDLSVIAFVGENRLEGFIYGIKLINVYDGWFHHLSLDMATDVDGAVAVWLSGGNEGCSFTNIDAVNAAPTAPNSSNTFYTLRVYNDAGTATPTRYVKFANCFWDSGTTGARLDDGVDIRFSNCWFSAWRDSPLLVTGTAQNCSWENCDFVGGGGVGVFVNSKGGGLMWNACHVIASNRKAIGASGFQFAAGASYFQVVNCKAVNDAINFPGTNQQYGIKIDNGVHHFFIQNVDVTGNTAGGVSIGTGCDYFKVDNVMATGYSGTGLVNDSGTSATKVIGTVFQ